VTGGAGYIGSCLVPELLRHHEVRVLDNLTYGYDGLLPHIGNPHFEFMYGDIRNLKVLQRALKGVDVVIHLAAIVGYPACKAQPELAHEVNYLATKKLAKAARAPIIFASTGSCYGHIDEECCETTSLDPQTEYAISKIQAEKAIKGCSDFIIYRFSTGFGLSLRPRLDLLINDFVTRAVKNKELIVYEKDYFRTFIHVKDMVASLLFALGHLDEMNREIYNVGSQGLSLTKGEVALRIQKYVKFHLKFADFGMDPDKRNYKVSFKKITDKGFSTRYSIDDGIKELVHALQFMDQKEWYYNHKVIK
jgi:nucleoside-diphosphate-sugar epimerase